MTPLPSKRMNELHASDQCANEREQSLSSVSTTNSLAENLVITFIQLPIASQEFAAFFSLKTHPELLQFGTLRTLRIAFVITEMIYFHYIRNDIYRVHIIH